MPNPGIAVQITVRSFTKKVIQAIENDAQKRALRIGHMLRNYIVTQLAGQRSGRVYRVPGTKRFYTASAPGEYPAVRTGYLRRSIRTVVRQDLWGVYAVVGTDVPYGASLERRGAQGLKGGRPWLTRAYAEMLPEIRKVLSTAEELDARGTGQWIQEPAEEDR